MEKHKSNLNHFAKWTHFLLLNTVNGLNHCHAPDGKSLILLTGVHNVLIPVKTLGAIIQECLVEVDWPDDTLLAQVPHEKLETNEGKDTQAEDSQDHHIRKLLHRLDQGTDDGLQAWRAVTHAHTYTHAHVHTHTHTNHAGDAGAAHVLAVNIYGKIRNYVFIPSLENPEILVKFWIKQH